MIIPSVPSFTAGEYDIANLVSLSSCVSFLTNAGNSPMWRFIKESGISSPTANAWSTAPFNTVLYDTDNIHNSTIGGVTTNTQGYYTCEASLSFEQGTVVFSVFMSFLWTAGANNPHHSSGTTIRFGGSGTKFGSGTADANDYNTVIADKCPVVCYPNDSIVVQIFPDATGVNTDTFRNSSPTVGISVPQFSGRWIGIGS